MSLSNPGKIYNPLDSKPSDACFNASMTEFCSHFTQSKNGETLCKSGHGGKVDKHAVNVLSTLYALPLCDSNVPGCSTNKFVISGTTQQCNPEIEADCTTTIGYLQCSQNTKWTQAF